MFVELESKLSSFFVPTDQSKHTDDGNINKQQVVRKLIQDSHIGKDFYFLLFISTLITTLGLMINSTAVVIGGMLIAPLLSPVLALGLGVVTDNKQSLLRSTSIIIKSIIAVLALSFVTAFFIDLTDPQNTEILQRAKPSLLYIYIALLSGFGASYAWSKPRISATLPGIAVSVALLPPLCVTGIGLSLFDKVLIIGSFQLFFVNLLAIAVSSAVVFSLFGFHEMRGVEQSEIIQEKIQQESSKKK